MQSELDAMFGLDSVREKSLINRVSLCMQPDSKLVQPWFFLSRQIKGRERILSRISSLSKAKEEIEATDSRLLSDAVGLQALPDDFIIVKSWALHFLLSFRGDAEGDWSEATNKGTGWDSNVGYTK
ncbi:unnamed protein product [Mycena citricolor]|uniref:Uncharacterized protein n=1 Tax=Mycena citricolor TaxID=2018698 RepID=A0AAD2H0H4_9AGAR|nr:unnamed protein product [Mycena citricolor]